MLGKEVTVEFNNSIAVITMRAGQNQLNMDFLSDINSALDEVLSKRGVVALITTGEKKFYSNGIDLVALGQASGEDKTIFMTELCNLMSRILTFPMPTVAAINGHAFAGGAFIAYSHDYRVMNSKRGWISINEVHLPSRIPFFLLDLLKAKLPKGHTQTEVITMGKRLTGPQAQALGVVQAIAEPEELLGTAEEILKNSLQLGQYDRDSIGWMKRDLYSTVLQRENSDVDPEPMSRL